jgi:hypothetical protein
VQEQLAADGRRQKSFLSPKLGIFLLVIARNRTREAKEEEKDFREELSAELACTSS